ncbi:DNA-directed RNA polymerase I subunit RPA34.5-domain-containing protein [Jackrogersella minutella]|nr:DNA-directed RNA polymerase I subunit RPA34.5-domain-containing protein [Jackrogersella minutella]
MAKHRPRAPIASLDSMAERIRDQKAASTSKASKLQNTQKVTETNGSDGSDDTSSDDSNESDSGSEVDLEAERKKYDARQASKRKAPQSKVNNSKSEPTKSIPNENSSSTSNPPTKVTTIDPEGSDPGSDSDSDSESQDSESSDSPAQKTTSKEGGASESEDESESDSSSSSESDSEDEVTSAKQPAEAELSSDEASDTSSSEASEMDVDDNNEMTVSRVDGDDVTQASTSQSSQPAWLNNSNFVLRKASSDNPAKEVTEFFSKANLEGKQVWYFTAPASLPITVLKDIEIDLSKATTGEALLNHKGDDYGLDLESRATSTQIQLLIPSRGGDKYAALNRGIDSTVHLRRVAKFGPGGTVSATATDDYAPIPKAIREQPEGLRPRFTPIGVPNPTPSQAPPSKQTVAEPISQLPASSKSSKSKKQDAVNGQLKRKYPGGEIQSTPIQEAQPQEKAAKRPKIAESTSKGTPVPVPIPSQAAPALNGTPSRLATPSNKDKAKKDKKYTMIPTKQTPVPVPTVPSMKR